MFAENPMVDRIWGNVLRSLERELSKPTFDNYVTTVTPLALEEGQFVIKAPNGFVRDWLLKRFTSTIEGIATEVVGTPAKLRIEVQSNAAGAGELEVTSSVTDTPRSSSSSTYDDFGRVPFNQKYTFENFVVGRSNQLSHAAALQVAKQPARVYNPLFLYGGVGLGKTHLMQAIGHHYLQRNPNAEVVYVPGETFLFHYVTSIREDRMAAFRRMYRSVDLWLVDDVQFISGRERTEAEFFHIFNALYDTQKQIVICSDRPPKELKLTEQRLLSRFEWGMICNLEAPDEEHRIAILQKKADDENAQVPNVVIKCIAERIRSNIRTLEGALTRVLAESSLNGRELTVELALEVLRHYSTADDRRTVTIETIQKVVSEHFRIPVEELIGKKRNKAVVLPRQISMYLARELTDQSFPDIAQAFGGRDHTTVIHSYEKIRREIAKDSRLKSLVDDLRSRAEL